MERGEGAVVITSKNNIKDYDLPAELDIPLESLFCVNCKRHLGYYAIIEGTIAIKCRRCRCWNIVDVRSTEARVDKKRQPVIE